MGNPKILEKLLKLSNILVLGNIFLFVIGSILAFFPIMMLFSMLDSPKEFGFYGVLFLLACVLSYTSGAVLFIWYLYYATQLRCGRIPLGSSIFWAGHFVYNAVHPAYVCVAVVRGVLETNPKFLFAAAVFLIPALWPFISLRVGWQIVRLESLWHTTFQAISYDHKIKALKQEEKALNQF